MRWLAVMALGATLAGCTAGQVQNTWMRHDGTPVDAGFHFVAAQCREVAEKVGKASPPSQRDELRTAAMNGCMKQHGYVYRCAHPLASFYDGACLKFEGIAPAIEMPEGTEPDKPGPPKRPRRS
jgi:hypothetical protein